MNANTLKVYVPVEVQFRSDGVMLPRMITWEDGTKYEIDRVTDIRQAAAMRAIAILQLANFFLYNFFILYII